MFSSPWFWAAVAGYLVFFYRSNGAPTLWEQWNAPAAASPITAAATIGGVNVSAVVDPVAVKALVKSAMMAGS